MDWLKMFQEFGLIGLIVGVLFFILWRMLCWVMAFIKDMTKQHTDERLLWNDSLNKHNDTLAKIAEGIDRHDERADLRGQYVRSEHEKMMKNLEEQGKILARINGYKEEK